MTGLVTCLTVRPAMWGRTRVLGAARRACPVSFVDGLDLSLTSTGLAAVNPHNGALHTVAFGSTGRATDTFADHLARQIELCDRIVEAVEASDPVLVVMESATFTFTPKDTRPTAAPGCGGGCSSIWFALPGGDADPGGGEVVRHRSVEKDKVLAQTFVAARRSTRFRRPR